MGKQVIVVVHGVGVREAGVSSDLLSAALDSNPPAGKDGRAAFDARSQQERDEDALRPISADDFILREPKEYASGAKYSTFPARIRRYRTKSEPGAASARERVISDFYWGDVTGTGGGLLQVVTGIFRLMLGLTHAVRENAWSVFPGQTGYHRAMRKIAGAAALTVHGPLFALNLMLALFALSLGGLNLAGFWQPNAVSDQIFGYGFWVVLSTALAAAVATGAGWKWHWPIAVVFGAGIAAVALLAGAFQIASDRQILGLLILVTLAAAAVMRWRASAFLLRYLSDWLVISSVALLTILIWPEFWESLFQSLAGRPLSDIVRVANPATDSRIILQAGSLMVVGTVLCWGLVILAAFWLLIARAVRAVAGWSDKKAVDFQAEAIALMLILWLVLTGAFWGAGLQLADRAGIIWGGSTEKVLESLIFVPMAVALLIALLAVMGATFLATRRRSGRKGAVSGYVADREARAEAGRLVVAKAGIWFLRGTVVVAGMIVIIGIRPEAWNVAGLSLADGLSGLRQTLGGTAGAALSVLAAVAALAIGLGRQVLGAAIGIVVDVLAYINNYSWNSWVDLRRLGGGQGQPATADRVDEKTMPRSPTILEIPFPFLAKGALAPRLSGYWFRRRIQDRMRVLVAELIRDEEPTELLIISHSQGTMISADVIEMEGRGWLELSAGKLERIRLVTMGSPIRHVYSHYFPRSFPMVMDRPNLQHRDRGGVLDAWTNIFRIDDFIGTHIDQDMTHQGDATWPREIAVNKNGHTMYWVDINVAQHLRDLAQFRAGATSKSSSHSRKTTTH